MADMATPPTSERDLLLAWVLGTFHAATLIIILLLALYITGGLAPLLTSLSTGAGLALFSALWFTTTWSAHRTLHGVFDETLQMALPVGKVIARALRRGGINGVAFLPFLGVILAVPAVLHGDILPVLYTGLVLATVGVAIAFLVGCMLGLLFAGIDVVLLSAARAIIARPAPFRGAPG
jgi:hypothetical protein